MNKPALKVEPLYRMTEIAEAYGVSYSFIQQQVTAGHLKAAQVGSCLLSTQKEVDTWWNARHERQADRRAGRVSRRDQKGKAPARVKAKTDYQPEVDSDIALALGLPT